MSRARDLALARLALLTARWDGGSGEPVGDSRRDPVPVGVRVLVGVVVIALVLAAWTLARSWPRAEAQVVGGDRASLGADGSDPGPLSPLPYASGSSVPSPPAELPGDPVPSGSPAPASSLVVHVAGEVRRPGLVVLPAGSRVGDAVQAAGGVRRGGSLGAVNLARVLADGERIEIGADAADGAPAAGQPLSGGPPAPAPVDLNTATADQLDTLPGIGPVTAAKILAWRAANDRFSVVDELLEVPGIGPRTLEELRPHVRV